MRHLYSFFSLYLVRVSFILAYGFTSFAYALSPDSVLVHYSQHGTQPGAGRQTFAVLTLPPTYFRSLRLRIDIPAETKARVSSYEILVSDSLAVRDLDDYKGRVSYRSIPVSNPTDITLSTKEIRNARYLYLTMNLLPDLATDTIAILSARVREASVDGLPLPLVEDGVSGRRLFETYKPLFVPGDTGSRNFRIPALLHTRKGSLIVMADRRKYNDVDLPEDIDIIMRRSEDQGQTWSEPKILVRGKGRGKGFGDVALVECPSGKLLMIYVGGPGLWGSTPEKSNRTYVSESTDDGITWSTPRDITPFIFGADCPDPVRAQWMASFCASGQGICTRDGRVMFVAAIREDSRYSLSNYLLYSDDEGKTWHLSQKAFDGGDESKIVQLSNGDILMSIRNKHHGDRYFVVSKDNGLTWTATSRYANLSAPAINGAILLVSHGGREYLLHSLIKGPKRVDGRIYAFDLRDWHWKNYLDVAPGPNAYSDMVLLDKDHLGYISEEDWQMSLVYVKIPIRDIFRQKK